MNPVRKWRIRRRLKRIERLKRKALDQMLALPTRQLRRKAQRQATKALVPRRIRKAGRSH